MIKSVTRNYLLNVFAFWLLPQYLSGLVLKDGWKSLFLICLVFTALHLIVKPILNTLLGTLNFLTLGLVGIGIDAVLLFSLTLRFKELSLVPWFFPGLSFAGFTIPAYNLNQIEVTLVAAIALSLIRQTLLFLL